MSEDPTQSESQTRESPIRPGPDPPVPPIVLDLGKVKRKRIKQLKRGSGPLLEEIHEAVASVGRELADEAEGKELLPVVLLYERKRKKPRGFFAW